MSKIVGWCSSCILLIFLAGCRSPAGPHINWHFVVPDNYHGFLAIQYDCPGGHPLPRKGVTAQIVFAQDGTFCTSDPYVASWSDSDTAVSASGQPVRVYVQPFDLDGKSYHGYGVYGGETLGIGGGTTQNPDQDLTFLIYRVGDMERAFQAHHVNDAAYPENFDDFLTTRFGLN